MFLHKTKRELQTNFNFFCYKHNILRKLFLLFLTYVKTLNFDCKTLVVKKNGIKAPRDMEKDAVNESF